MLEFKRKSVLRLNSSEIEALISAIYTQLEVLKNQKDRDAKWDIYLLKKIVKRLENL